MKNKDEFYMSRCIELAYQSLGKTYPNPMVGAVIVFEDRIIGEGYHYRAGENHAEINAINCIKIEDIEKIKESTLYVSLEPCSHFGKTPPCSLKVKELGFKKVVVGAVDSHQKVFGKGIQLLKESGIEVEKGILEKEARELNKRFFCFHEKKRPYIVLKWAESSDGFMDKNFQPTQISNSVTSQWVHQIRAQEHAILVGTNTAIRDNPKLNTRKWKGKNPIRILIDMELKVPLEYQIFNTEAETLVFNLKKNEIQNHIRYIKIEGKCLVSEMMTELHRLEIQSVIVEGGSLVLSQFIEKNIWDEAWIIKNSSLILGNGTPAPHFPFDFDKKIKKEDNFIEFYKNKKM